MSRTGANAEIIKDTGEITDLFSPLSCHTVFIDKESLPTGIDTPKSWQSSDTADTATYKFASSPATPHAAIQLADNLISPNLSIFAAAILVKASATAIRTLAAGFLTARVGRSPIAIASPLNVSKPIAVTAQSATGT